MRKKAKSEFFSELWAHIKKDKKAFFVFVLLYILVFGVIVANGVRGRWDNVFTGVLAALLLPLPPLVEKSFRIDFPTVLEISSYLFVFAAEILGETFDFYQKYPVWDLILHTVNGFIFAAVGFCLVDLMHRKQRASPMLSPLFLALVALCFSMTVGVFWEFFEFFMDAVFHTDMQKDLFLHEISTVSLPNTLGEKVTRIVGINGTTVVTESGQSIAFGGYLDIGLFDTVKDLFVNFVGAFQFCIIGYVYLKYRGTSWLAKSFIPKTKEEE